MITAIILAAGRSSRLNQSVPKPFLTINNKKILDYSIKTFQNNVDKIIIVVPAEWEKTIQNDYPNHNVITGGTTGKESSYKGLMACNKKTTKVLIHDAARPFVNNRIITDCINKLDDFDAVTTAVKPVDTIITIDKNNIDNVLIRKLCRLEQTPQAFKYDMILKAHKSINIDTTDDIYIAYSAGAKCGIVDGSYNNFKITNDIDLDIAKKIVETSK